MEGSVVAVLGGGQLGRMLGLAGIPLGLRFRFLDPSPDAPAGAVGVLVVGALGDTHALDEVTSGAAVATYEWEGVPASAARHLGSRLPVRPGVAPLEVAQDRLTEKQTFRRVGIEVAEHVAVDDEPGLSDAVARIGLPAVLKTRRGGYDGRGQVVLRSGAGVEDAWRRIGGHPSLLEAQVPFTRELSIVAVRGLDGSTACYPLVENHHEGGILRLTRAPAPGLSEELQRDAEGLVTRLLDELAYVGVLAVELFEHEGRLLANEMAPRVHNSAHWTIEGAATSQFEHHLRAILGMPLGSTATVGHAAMLNCIGALPDPRCVLAVEGAHLHVYAKEPRPGRKLGHVTVVASTAGELDLRLEQVQACLREPARE